MKYKEFYNGLKIPMLGFGVYQIPEYEEAKRAVLSALKIGYRLIDTWQ
ncbi:MAG: 2,5-diketo-D-gluconic acid reductase [Lachnospiraceae bacterium]|nr:2,5-diketo-D-gluconic acid reductase [Lachnospiraceae bacterium]